MRHVLFAIGAAGLLATPLQAAEICYSAAVDFTVTSPPDNSTVFHCPMTGNLTIPQLAQAGWSIRSLKPAVVSATEQATQLVIQRAESVFRNGFQ